MSDIGKRIASAAADGISTAGDHFVQALDAAGQTSAFAQAPDGSVNIVIEGAGALAREFGAHRRPPQPVLGPMLQANRSAMLSLVGNAIGEALRRRA